MQLKRIRPKHSVSALRNSFRFDDELDVVRAGLILYCWGIELNYIIGEFDRVLVLFGY